MRNGRAISKQRRMQKSGQRRAEEELRCFLCAGRATQLFAWCESRGQEAESPRDADGFRHSKAQASSGKSPILSMARAISFSWRPRGHVIAMVGDGCPVEWSKKV